MGTERRVRPGIRRAYEVQTKNDGTKSRSRNDYGSAMIWNGMFMAFTPKQTILRGSEDGRRPETSGHDQPHPAGHPAGGRFDQGRSPGSRISAPSPPSRVTQWHDGESTRRSQLRGQPRLRRHHVRYRIPVLAPDSQTNRREPRTLDMVYEVKLASTAMKRLCRIHRG